MHNTLPPVAVVDLLPKTNLGNPDPLGSCPEDRERSLLLVNVLWLSGWVDVQGLGGNSTIIHVILPLILYGIFGTIS